MNEIPNGLDYAIVDKVAINQIGRRSKYRWFYHLIQTKLRGEQTLIVKGIDTVNYSKNLQAAANRMFSNLKYNYRKYDEKGLDIGTLYIKLKNGNKPKEN